MTTKTATRRSTEDRKAQAQQLHDDLTAKISELTQGDNWKTWLDFAARFRHYSFGNMLLIQAQMPGATHVAGYRAFQAMGRQVRKGEKAIKIFGYSTKKLVDVDEETGTETVTGKQAFYPVLSVFDISQTDGDEIPAAPAQPVLLEGDDETAIYERTAAFLRGRGWDVAVEPIAAPGVNGFTSPATREIRVDEALSPAARAKTGLHEAAHAILHVDADEPSQHRGIREVEAESVAYILGAMLGLDTSSYSISYVTGWARADVELIRSTASNVLRAVGTLADALLPAGE